jgi:hypothetical protein
VASFDFLIDTGDRHSRAGDMQTADDRGARAPACALSHCADSVGGSLLPVQ